MTNKNQVNHKIPPQFRSQKVKDWESWCHQQRKRVKVVEADIPEGILPKGVKGSLADIKVGEYVENDVLSSELAQSRVFRSVVTRGLRTTSCTTATPTSGKMWPGETRCCTPLTTNRGESE